MRTKLQTRLALPLAALLVLLTALALASGPAVGFGQPQIGAVHGSVPIIQSTKVVNFGKVVYTGSIDVNPTLARIRAGQKVNEKNDGGIFTNSGNIVPHKSDTQYYREFVSLTGGPGNNGTFNGKVSFPGPQRLLIGKGGEVYYTGDHYATAVKVN